MNFLQSSVVLAACIVLCLSHPTSKSETLPVLKDQPAEVLFKADNYSTVLLECKTENEEKNVKYTWHKNGAPFDWEAAGHIGQRQGEGSIMFFNPQPKDEGIYQCFAKTVAGTASTRPIALKEAFIKTPPEVETKTHKPVFGKPYKLNCGYYYPASYPLVSRTWKTQLRSDPKIVEEVSSRRITVTSDGTLWFSNITESDVSPSYKYICVAYNPVVKKEVIFAEHYMPEFVKSNEPNDGELVEQYLSEDLIAKVGNVTMFYCVYGGTPLGFPNWYKNGVLIEAKGSDRVTDHNRTSGKRLLIKETLLEDQATYSCEVNNGVGKKQTHTMKLTVVSAPTFVEKLGKQLNVEKSHDIKIPCKVTGVPEPKVTWTYNGKPLDSVNYKNGVLTLSDVKQTHTGYYGCKAENEHGLIYAETLVNVA